VMFRFFCQYWRWFSEISIVSCLYLNARAGGS
jgi:hypothetical protein